MKINDNLNLSGPAYKYLLDAIFGLKIRPGEKILEGNIANELGISRTPVRQAVFQLANDGLVIIEPNRFVKVVEFDDDAIRQIGETRIFLETSCIKYAMYYGSTSDFTIMKQIAEKCIDAAAAGDVFEMNKHDASFHIELAKATKNTILLKFQTEICKRIQLLAAIKYEEDKNILDQAQYHLNLVEELINRNENEAVKKAIDHIMKFYGLRDKNNYAFFEKNYKAVCLSI